VASVLNVRAAPGRSSIGALADHLQTSRTLLILHNCEHLIEVCEVLAEMLLLLATSREALGVAFSNSSVVA
jgi:predicted ATPase